MVVQNCKSSSTWGDEQVVFNRYRVIEYWVIEYWATIQAITIADDAKPFVCTTNKFLIYPWPFLR